jgi:hypothetical protein
MPDDEKALNDAIKSKAAELESLFEQVKPGMRYISIHPSAWSYTEWGDPHPTTVVHETDRTPERTGILDANGTPLYRVRETVPFGFQGVKR